MNRARALEMSTENHEEIHMAFGILLVIAGILIAVYPPLLSIILASVLIIFGVTITMVAYRVKKMQKRFDDPFVDFFFRF